jgi:hypothetical protein
MRRVPIILLTKALERADGVAQVVEHLPSNHETLSSNPNTKKTKKALENTSRLKYLLYG